MQRELWQWPRQGCRCQDLATGDLFLKENKTKRKKVGSGEVKEEGFSSFSCRAKKWSDCETYVYQSSLELLRLDDS